MKNMKIGAKIVVGFGIVILLMLIIVGVVVVTNTSTVNNVEIINEAAALQTVSNDMLIEFNAARLQANILYNGYSEDANSSFRALAAATQEELDDIFELIAQYPYLEDFRDEFDTAQSSFAEWNRLVESVIAGNDQLEAVSSELLGMGTELKDSTDKLLTSQMENMLLEAQAGGEISAQMVRRNERIADADVITDHINMFRITLRSLLYNYDLSSMDSIKADLDAAVAAAEAYRDDSAQQADKDEAQHLIDVVNTVYGLTEQFAGICATNNESIAAARSTGDVAGNAANAAFAELDGALAEQITSTTSAANSTRTLVIIISALSMVLGVVLALVIMRAITRPVKAIAEIAEKVAKGDTDVDCKPLFSKDETGMLAQAFDRMITAIRLLIADANMLVEAATGGQLSVRADASRHDGDYRRIVEGVNETVEALVGPIRVTADALNELAQGNLGKRIDGEYPGEFKDIQQTINFTLQTIQDYISEVSARLSDMAEGDMTVSITNEYRGDFVELKNSINAIASSLNDVMSNINVAADQVATGTQHVSDGSQAVSQGATEQASSIEELTATITEIAEQIRMTAENAAQVNTVATGTREKASEGNAQMKQLQVAMGEINDSSANISKIIKVIDDIAFQTNILALNAAVEAARAGVHGKGFAVVAEEVRNLAAKSASAAKETTDLIESSVQKTQAGTEIADVTAQSLEQIVEMVAGAVEALGAIATASNEQASGVAQVNKGIEQLSEVVQSNSATSEESAAAAEELSSQATLLKQLIARFKVQDTSASSYEPVQRAIPAPAVPERQRAIAAGEYRAAPEDTIHLSDDDFGKY